jgi:hypothetical protein
VWEFQCIPAPELRGESESIEKTGYMHVSTPLSAFCAYIQFFRGMRIRCAIPVQERAGIPA